MPEGLFQAEETILTGKEDLPGGAMEVGTSMLFHEIIGFAIAGEVDFVPVLLHIVPEVK